jgi:hypothetical protein
MPNLRAAHPGRPFSRPTRPQLDALLEEAQQRRYGLSILLHAAALAGSAQPHLQAAE